MDDENSIIYFDGEYIKLKDAKISILTHALHYGSSAFEGIRAYETKRGPAIFRLKEHIDRLFYSAESLFMKIPFSKDEIMGACAKVVSKNGFENAYLRPIVFYGDGGLGIDPSKNKVYVAIIALKWGAYLPEKVKVMVSKTKRISEETTVVDAKIGGHYVNSIFSTIEAKSKGYDEALLLDHEENIAEGPGENIFFIKGKVLYTPCCGKILKGITRQTILDISHKLGYDIVEKDIALDEIENFESAFFTGTAAEITPISSIGDTEFDISKVDKIKIKYFEIVKGEDKTCEEWLTYC